LVCLHGGGKLGFKGILENNITPFITALGTCSSIATIPANLEGAEKSIFSIHQEVVIPLGAP
jgi:Na+/H+-dicarboxylate symporter